MFPNGKVIEASNQAMHAQHAIGRFPIEALLARAG